MTTNSRWRHDFVFVTVANRDNPNGDPDNAGQPRVDSVGYGYQTGESIRRKLRDRLKAEGHEIIMERGTVLNAKIADAHKDARVAAVEGKTERIEEARKHLMRKYIDVRLFGGVFSTDAGGDEAEDDADSKPKGKKKGSGFSATSAGRVRGAFQIQSATSLDPVTVMPVAITRCLVTREEDAEKGQTMGDRAVVEHGVYVAHGTVMGNLCAANEVAESDIAAAYQALMRLYDDDAAANRMLEVGALVVMKHDGSHNRHDLYRTVERCLREGKRPTQDMMPSGVELDVRRWSDAVVPTAAV